MFNQFDMPLKCSEADGVGAQQTPLTLIENNLKDDKLKIKKKVSHCKSRLFDPVETILEKQYSDYQEIKLNELFKTLAPGLIPRSLQVVL